MIDLMKFESQLKELEKALMSSKTVLITAPAAADGDSIGAQLSLRRMLLQKFSKLDVKIINDEPLPPRYQFLPDVDFVDVPDKYPSNGRELRFDVAFIVDGGIDRAGRVRDIFERSQVKVFIDHHAVSVNYPYTIKFVESTASATTELMYHLSQTPLFRMRIDSDFAQQVYLGLIFDTGFFRHSNTTPEVMELGAKLLRTGFDFTRVGERGMLERTFPSLKLMSDTLSRAELSKDGKLIWSTLTQKRLKEFSANEDDREGIIDHLFLTHGIEVALLFFELSNGGTKISFRSQGRFDVAAFASSITERGGGHQKAAGANMSLPIDQVVPMVIEKLSARLREHRR